MTQSDIDRIFTIVFVFTFAIFLLIFKWLRGRPDSGKDNGAAGDKRNGATGGKSSGAASGKSILVDLTGETDNLVMERYLIILAAVVVRLVFAGAIEGFPSDIACFKSWSNSAAEDFFGLYSKGEEFFLDYPPGYMYVLFILGKIREIFSIPSASTVFTFLIKTPAMAADIVSGCILYKLSEGNMKERQRLFVMSVYLFNPAVFFLSTIWGQIDSIMALLILMASLSLYKEKYESAAVFFALGVLVKPQGIIFLPVLFFEFLYVMLVKKQIKRIMISSACFVGTLVLAILPFSFGQHPMWVVNLYFNTLGGYNYASMNAYNFYSLLGANLKSDSATFLFLKFSTWGFLFIVIFTVLTGVVSYLYHRRESDRDEKNTMPFLGSAILLVGVTTFGPKMHERYFFPALLLLLAVYCLSGNGFFGAICALMSTAGFFNILFVFSMYYTRNYDNMAKSPMIFFLSGLTVFSTVILWLYIFRQKGVVTTNG